MWFWPNILTVPIPLIVEFQKTLNDHYITTVNAVQTAAANLATANFQRADKTPSKVEDFLPFKPPERGNKKTLRLLSVLVSENRLSGPAHAAALQRLR